MSPEPRRNLTSQLNASRGDTGCSSRDVQSRSLSDVFSLARCRARSLQGIEACPHRVRGLYRSVHSAKLVPEQEKPRTDSGAGWMMLICFKQRCSPTARRRKTGLNTNVNHARQNVPTVQTTLHCLLWNYSDLCKRCDVQRISDSDGFFLSSAAVEKCDIWSSQSAMQATRVVIEPYRNSVQQLYCASAFLNWRSD